MKSESEILAKYRDVGEFLTQMDIKTEAEIELSGDENEVYDTCCREFEILHWVLDMPGQPYWRT